MNEQTKEEYKTGVRDVKKILVLIFLLLLIGGAIFSWIWGNVK